jgi:hypothetical protein
MKFRTIAHGLSAITLAWSCMAGHARAAESLSELTLGGLVFAKSPDVPNIGVDSEEIVINPAWVTVKYRFTNHAAAPATLTLTFPLPELDFSDPDVSFAIPGSDPLNFVGLSTRIAGKPGHFALRQVARLDGKDVTATLRQNRLALIPVGTFQNQLAALPAETVEKLSEAGLIVQSGNDVQGNALYFPSWTVHTSATRKYTFPPEQPVDVELRYRTSVGTSPDTVLRKALRGQSGLAKEVQRYKADYCVDEGFFNGLDKIASAAEANTAKVRERRIAYNLAAGAPASPIKDFRLVVDKGRPDRVVSFCMDNLKKISPTAFEIRATDYMPDHKLKVLMIGVN